MLSEILEEIELDEIQCEACSGESLDLVTVNEKLICIECVNAPMRKTYCGE